jgi:hypothetical protein
MSLWYVCNYGEPDPVDYDAGRKMYNSSKANSEIRKARENGCQFRAVPVPRAHIEERDRIARKHAKEKAELMRGDYPALRQRS